MSAAELVAGVVSAFFAIGIAVGVIGVMALGTLRGRHKTSDPDGNDEENDGPPRWPAG